VALTFRFWGCAITACICEIQAKPENAVEEKEAGKHPVINCTYLTLYRAQLAERPPSGAGPDLSPA
jgi:hypothetical protein